MLKCEYCDSMLEEGTASCPHCGGIVTQVPVPEPEAQAVPEYPETFTEESEPAEDASTITKTILGAAGAALLGSLLTRRTRQAPVLPLHGSPARTHNRPSMDGSRGKGSHRRPVGYGGGRGGRGVPGGRR